MSITKFLDWFLPREEEKKPESILNGIKLNELVKQKFEDTSGDIFTLPFFARTKIVNAEDEEILAYSKYIRELFETEINDGDTGEIKTEGKFVFKSYQVPNIKMGQRIGQAVLFKDNRNKRGIAPEGTASVLDGYRLQLANNLSQGLKQRINQLICAFMLGEVNTSTLKLKLKTPPQLHRNGDWSKPFPTILKHLAVQADQFGESPNRITLSLNAYNHLLASEEFKESYSRYRQENKDRFQEYINDHRERHDGVEPFEHEVMLHFAPSVVYLETGLYLDIYDKMFNTKALDGTLRLERYLPEDKVLFSNSDNDNNPMVMDFANGVTSESVVAGYLFNNTVLGAEYGPTSYFVGNENLNPPDIKAWAVIRGLPRLHQPTAFSSITI